jgi:mRNA-degrading endonuclease RelE of RelBE toxin-antitoxin system
VYKVDLGRRAQKDLDKLQGHIFDRVETALKALAANPRPFGYDRIEGLEDGFRIREGDYRILIRH